MCAGPRQAPIFAKKHFFWLRISNFEPGQIRKSACIAVAEVWVQKCDLGGVRLKGTGSQQGMRVGAVPIRFGVKKVNSCDFKRMQLGDTTCGMELKYESLQLCMCEVTWGGPTSLGTIFLWKGLRAVMTPRALPRADFCEKTFFFALDFEFWVRTKFCYGVHCQR